MGTRVGRNTAAPCITSGSRDTASSIRQWSRAHFCLAYDRLDTIPGDFKLIRNFGNAYAKIEVIQNRLDGHSCSTKNRSATLHARLSLYKRAFRPVNVFGQSHVCTLLPIASSLFTNRPWVVPGRRLRLFPGPPGSSISSPIHVQILTVFVA